LQGAQLDRANLEGARLIGANLETASMRAAILIGTQLDAARLVSASLQGALLISTTMVAANLQDANLTGAIVKDADLRGAKLTGAQLDATDLRGSNLWGMTELRINGNFVDLRDAHSFQMTKEEVNRFEANVRGYFRAPYHRMEVARAIEVASADSSIVPQFASCLLNEKTDRPTTLYKCDQHWSTKNIANYRAQIFPMLEQMAFNGPTIFLPLGLWAKDRATSASLLNEARWGLVQRAVNRLDDDLCPGLSGRPIDEKNALRRMARAERTIETNAMPQTRRPR
jgi:hypothetical protein